MAGLIYAMDWEFDAGQIEEAVEALSPEIYTSLTTAAFGAASLFGQAGSQRMEELRRSRALGQQSSAQAQPVMLAMAGNEMADLSGAAPIDEASGWGVWTRFMAAQQNLPAQGGKLGYRQDLGGVAAGVDGPLFDGLQLGFLAGVSQGDLSWSRAGYSGDQNGVHAGIYAQTDLNILYFNALFGYSRFENQADREVSFTDFSGIARGGFDSEAYQGVAELGSRILAGGWLLSPSVSVVYINLQEDGFEESGADFVSLGVECREHESLSSRAGLRMAVGWNLGGALLVPRIGAFWVHEFMDDAPSLSAHFRDYGDISFSSSGQVLDEDRALLEAGLDLELAQAWSMKLTYNLKLGEYYSCQSFMAGLVIWF